MRMVSTREICDYLLAQRMQPPPPPPPPPPTQRFVTAASQRGLISFDGRSPTSPAYFGGSAYVVMCRSCGLEPIGRAGYHSNCICCCKTCSRLLNGRGNWERLCDRCSGSVTQETVPIGTTHVKAKPSRPAAPAGAAIDSLVACGAHPPGPVRAQPAVCIHISRARLVEPGGGAAQEGVPPSVLVDDDDPPLWLQQFMRVPAAQVGAPPIVVDVAASGSCGTCFCGLLGEAVSCPVCAPSVPS